MTRRRIPRVQRPARYRMEALPGLAGAEAKEWSLPAAPDGAEQGWLCLDGAVLGPLFDQPTTEER